MAAIKTKASDDSVEEFLEKVEDEQKRKDSFELLALFKTLTKEEPRLWGGSVVGFGKFHYKSERSAQQGEWYYTGFAPRKQAMTVYMMGMSSFKEKLPALGKFTTGGGCLYFKKLADIDKKVLRDLLKENLKWMKAKYK